MRSLYQDRLRKSKAQGSRLRNSGRRSFRTIERAHERKVCQRGATTKQIVMNIQMRLEALHKTVVGVVPGADSLPLRKTPLFFECFPYVCPEPVLVK